MTASLSGTGSLAAGTTVLVVSADSAHFWDQPTVLSASLSGTESLAAAATQPATASLSGAATLSPASAQAPAATLAGTGSLAALVRQPSTASLAGTGQITASAAQRAVAALSGSGSITAASGVSAPGTASLSGSGAAIAPHAAQGCAAALTGTGQITASARQGCAAQLSGSGSLAATSGGSAPGSASLSGTGSLSAATGAAASASMAGSGSIAAIATTIPGPVTLAGSGMMAPPLVKIAATAMMAGTGTLTATGTLISGFPVSAQDGAIATEAGYYLHSGNDGASAEDSATVRTLAGDSASGKDSALTAWPRAKDSASTQEGASQSGGIQGGAGERENPHTAEAVRHIALSAADSAAISETASAGPSWSASLSGTGALAAFPSHRVTAADSAAAAERSLSAWPRSADSARLSEAARWSGPLAASDTGRSIEGHEAFRFHGADTAGASSGTERTLEVIPGRPYPERQHYYTITAPRVAAPRRDAPAAVSASAGPAAWVTVEAAAPAAGTLSLDSPAGAASAV